MTRPETGSAAAGLRAHAFGLAVAAPGELVGLPADPDPGAGPRTWIELAAPGPAPRPGGEEVRMVRGPDGEVSLSVHRENSGGYLLRLHAVGAYRIAADGLRVTCFPDAGVERWRWQRAIVNQVLPLAATLRGFEVLHAGAVSMRGRVVAIVGHPGAGKSSTTLNLLLRGAGFFTDDALAVERRGESIVAHPGAAVANFPRDERELMAGGEPERLGTVLGGEADFKSLLAVEREESPLPLGALYFLRRDRDEPETRFEPVVEGAAAMLLGSTYVLSVRSPRRLGNQLDLCAAIAGQTPIFDVLVPPAVAARESAAAIMEHAGGLLEGAAA
jgi:hypothetical protein